MYSRLIWIEKHLDSNLQLKIKYWGIYVFIEKLRHGIVQKSLKRKEKTQIRNTQRKTKANFKNE